MKVLAQYFTSDESEHHKAQATLMNWSWAGLEYITLIFLGSRGFLAVYVMLRYYGRPTLRAEVFLLPGF